MSEELELIHLAQNEIDKVRIRVHALVNEVAAQNLLIVKLEDKLDAKTPCNIHVNIMKEFNDGINEIKIISAAMQGKLEGFTIMARQLLEKHDLDLYKENGLLSTSSSNKKQIALLWAITSSIFIAGGAMFIWRR